MNDPPCASFPRLALLAALALAPAARAAAPPTIRPTKDGMDTVFGLLKVHQMHLTISAADWATMQPKTGGFGPAGQPGKANPDGRMVRSQFGFDFEYVPAALTIDGQMFDKVGVRFKGNSSYAVASRVLKRPLKIDLDRYDASLNYRGLKKLALNNGVMDGSLTREALAYQIYREAGVPAPRTAFVLLTLTVPGKYDKEVVGVFTQIEVVDKAFLQDRFGSKKGMLLKPERVGPLDHLGSNWKPYEDRYRPKVTPSKRVQERFMAFTKLVQDPDHARFVREIGDYLDVDQFLRYLATTSLIVSMDSFMGLPHNYYICHDPLTDKFRILPWDLDHSFGGLGMFGSRDELVNLSIKQPWLGRNPLVEKLLKDPATYARYRAVLESILKTSFTAARIKADSDAINRVLSEAKAKERMAAQRRGDSWSLLPMGLLIGSGAGAPEVFAPKRIAAVEAQLAGTKEGAVLTARFGRPAAPPMPAKALLEAIDGNKDGKVTLDEAKAGAKKLFEACRPDAKGALDLRAFTNGLERVWPGAKPGGFFGPPSQAALMARAVFKEAGKDGKMTEAALVAQVEKAFGKDGPLDEKALEAALKRLMGGRP